MTAAHGVPDLLAARAAKTIGLRGLQRGARPGLGFEVEHSHALEEPPSPRFHLLTLAELAARPDPSYLIGGLIPEGGLALLHGHPGDGKSLLALDWALCVASRVAGWMGRSIRPGRVVYVAGEGTGGLKQRVAAWRSQWGIVGVEPNLQFVTEPIPLLSSDTGEAFLNSILTSDSQQPPALIIVDTLARCTAGGDENSVADTSRAIATLDCIRQGTGAAILCLHHSRKDSDVERGSGNLRAAVDVVLLLRQDDGIRELRVTKCRDGDLDAGLRFRLQPELDSVVLHPTEPGDSVDSLSRSARVALDALSSVFAGEPVRTADWMDVAKLNRSTFQQARSKLVRLGLIRQGRLRGAYEPVSTG